MGPAMSRPKPRPDATPGHVDEENVLEGSAYDGRAVCRLRRYNGTTLVSGTFEVDNGSGQFARVVRLDIAEVGRAEIITPTGAPVAAAVFGDNDDQPGA
jgi:hypothetical protein